MDEVENILKRYEETNISRTFGGWGVGLSPVFMSTTIPTFMASGHSFREVLRQAHESAEAWRVKNGYNEWWVK